MNLVIVESPTKAKTISKFLGKDFKIESSFGHVRDLPKRELGVDINNNFTPTYVIPPKAKKNLAKLKEAAKKAERIILATDEDREGEAIAWHLLEALKIKSAAADRIVFHEITRDAILEALRSPKKIDMNLVGAQQARRVLDRLVGYELSPFLWKKVAKGLSAGRVQSVAVRLVVEREREITNFKSEEYWTIEADLRKKSGSNRIVKARLHKISGRSLDRLEIKDQQSAEKIIKDLDGAKYIIANIEQKQTKKNPLPPFTTSTLQQTANRWLGFSAKQTMLIAQQLYEGVEIKGEGSVGLITYMRTDSLNLSEKFLSETAAYLRANYGAKYVLPAPRRFKTKSKGAQEAHEAIRPAEVRHEPEAIKSSLANSQYKLYNLIWQRAVASQMPEAVLNTTAVDIEARATAYEFRASGQILEFDGFLKVYPEKSQEIQLPPLAAYEELDLAKLNNEQHFTKPPARYSDAGLVKAMERYGIGRPSTYAPTIATIEARNYIYRDQAKKLAPNEIAFIVNDLLTAHFPSVVDYQFTAKMESDLDRIAEGDTDWPPVIAGFYGPFHDNLLSKYKEINKDEVMPEEKSNEACDKCGAPMIIKTGRYGKFLACSAFPECKNIKSLNGNGGQSPEKSEKIKELEEKYREEKCEKCGSDMVVKNGRYGLFLACGAYPKCKNIKNINGGGQGTGVTCPACGKGEIVQKRSRRGIFYACNRYPECKNALWAKPTGKKCPDCGSLLVEGKNAEVRCSNKECGYKE